MYVSSDPGTYMVRFRFTFKTGCDRGLLSQPGYGHTVDSVNKPA
jgi:hypothetical protein